MFGHRNPMDGNHMVLLSFSLVFFFSWNDRNRGPLDKCFFLHQTMSCRFECVCVWLPLLYAPSIH